MIYSEILPSLALQPFVKNYLLVGFDTALPAAFATKPYPARIEQALMFFAKGYINNDNPVSGKMERVATTAIFGQQTGRLNFETCFEPDFLMVMVVFKPGALRRLLGIANHELTGQYLDAEPLFGAELQQVNDLIANANNPQQMIAIVEEFLLKKAKKTNIESSSIERIGELMLTNPSRFSLDWLADQACLSPRQFERRFKERMGVSPKFYAKISRFYQAFTYKELHPHTDWLTVALHFGYTDYYHLSKDFKQFSHVTPNILIQEYAFRPEKYEVFFEKTTT